MASIGTQRRHWRAGAMEHLLHDMGFAVHEQFQRNGASLDHNPEDHEWDDTDSDACTDTVREMLSTISEVGLVLYPRRRGHRR